MLNIFVELFMRKSIVLGIAFLLTLALIVGCSDSNKSENSDLKAIYLTPQEGGQLTAQELKNHPEILVVNSFTDLKDAVQIKCAIWIDKDAVNMIDENWLHDDTQMYCPLVLIGYNNALYSFREKLTGFSIEGPYVDWNIETLEPGFSIWMLIDSTDTSTSSVMNGYDESPSAKRIISLTNKLIEEYFPE
jgi:hypothetical protein